MASAFTSIIACLALFIAGLQETAKNKAPSAPMRPEFIVVAAAPMQFKASADLQRAFSAEAMDAFSITAEIAKLTVSSDDEEAAKIISVIDKLLLKGPQYIVAGLSIDETDLEPDFFIAIQFKDSITELLFSEINEKQISFIDFCISDNVVIAIPKHNAIHTLKLLFPSAKITEDMDHQNTLKEIQLATKKTDAPQTAVLPEGAFLRVTADISMVDNPEEALRELMDTPFPEFASVRFADIIAADELTMEARFADAQGASKALKIVSKAKKFLLKEFANYPIYNAEIKKTTVTQRPVSNADNRGSFRAFATIPYDALTATSSAASKKNDAFMDAILGNGASEKARHARNDKKQTTQCTSNLKQLMLAVTMYSMDNDDILPAAANWQKLLKEYVGDEKTNVCPATQKPYIYALNGQSLKDIKQPSKTIAFYEDFGGHKDAINIAFVDGHVETAKLNGELTIEELADAKGFILLRQ